MVLSGVPSRYGAADLKAGYQGFLLRALVLSSFIHFVLLGLYWVKVSLTPVDHTPKRRLPVPPREGGFYLSPPINVDMRVVSAFNTGSRGSKVDIGTPTPVPGIAAEKWSARPIPSSPEGIGGEGTVVEREYPDFGFIDLPIETSPLPFVPFEKEPVVIKEVKPAYPEIAQKAGLEGTVYAKLWITREGKVKEVLIIKSDSEIFNQVVIDAAKQFLFTPAMMKNGPVAVWMTKRFNFILTNGTIQ